MNTENKPNGLKEANWMKTGLIWGACMFVFSIIKYPYFEEGPLTLKVVLTELIIWTMAGLGFGFVMKLIMKNRS